MPRIVCYSQFLQVLTPVVQAAICALINMGSRHMYEKYKANIKTAPMNKWQKAKRLDSNILLFKSCSEGSTRIILTGPSNCCKVSLFTHSSEQDSSPPPVGSGLDFPMGIYAANALNILIKIICGTITLL